MIVDLQVMLAVTLVACGLNWLGPNLDFLNGVTMSGCLVVKQWDLQPGWEDSNITGETPNLRPPFTFSVVVFNTYLCRQTMHVGSRIHWEIQNTCQCVHLRMSSELGICICIYVCVYTSRKRPYTWMYFIFFTWVYFKGCFVGIRMARVAWCLSGTAGLLAFSRSHLYLVKVSSSCVLHFSGSVHLAALLGMDKHMPPLSTLPLWIYFDGSEGR